MNDRLKFPVSTGILKAGFLAAILYCTPLAGQEMDSILLPIRNLRLSIHVFQDDSGVGNFSRESADQVHFLSLLTDWVNNRMANLDTLKPAVPSPFVADLRVRIRVDTIFYHRDTRAWDCSREIDSPYMRDLYVDGDTTLNYQQKYQTLPVFIGANNPLTGGHSRNLGDRGYIAVRGYFESFLRQPLAQAVDECGRNLIHELGHCLGLAHNFTGGPGGDQCDDCEDNGCPLEGTSNNIMDYWPSYGYAISKCQFNQVHFFLNGGRGNISEIVINDSCYREPGPKYEISQGDTVRIPDTVYLHNDLLIKAGGVLKVTGYLSMPGNTKITVEAGGLLEVDGGTIGNLCGDLWTGIRLVDSLGVKPPRISIQNGGTIENAWTGLVATTPLDAKFEHSVFSNCPEAIVIRGNAQDTIRIEGCTFKITTKLNHYEDGIFPEIFTRFEGVKNLMVSNSHFINEPGTFIFDADWMGTGILADGPMISVISCEFENLTFGLDLRSADKGSKLAVSGNLFKNNRYGIASEFSGIQLITDNRMVLQRFNTGSTLGILVRQPKKMALCNNSFESVYGSGSMAGIAISGLPVETSPVFNNDFSNLPVGVFIDGAPDIDSTLFQWAGESGTDEDLRLGPQLRFNRFDSVGLSLAVIVDSVYGSALTGSLDGLPEVTGGAAQWNAGGYGWYSGQIHMAAFNGWERGGSTHKDHGFFWFMNYLGITETGPIDFVGQDAICLKEYLNGILAIEEQGVWPEAMDVYEALVQSARIPATLRSGKLAGIWSKFSPDNQPWLQDALSSISSRFVNEDRLLTGLGTTQAKRNLSEWSSANPTPEEYYNPRELRSNTGFDLPDFSIFRFATPRSGIPGPVAFEMYPNPAQDFIKVRPMPGYSYDQQWSGYLFSANGHFVKILQIESWEDQKISISDIPAGAYMIELFSGNQYLGAGKFIKITHR